MVNFKRIALIVVFTLYISFNTVVSMGNDKYSKALFPPPNSLSKDGINWKQSAVSTSNESDGCLTYLTKYTYNSSSSKVKLGMHRDSSYFVDIRVFNCFDSEVAKNKYNHFKLVSIKNKHSIQLESDLQANFFIIPGATEQLKSDYYLNYLKGNFVIQAYSDDGFALVDVSKKINKALDLFVSQDEVKKLSTPSFGLTVSAKNYKPYSYPISINSSNTTIIFHGAVYGDNYEPLPEATIEIDSLGLKTQSNNNGYFKIIHNKQLNDSILSIYQNIYLNKSSNNIETFSSGVYFLNLTFNSIKTATPKIWNLNTDSHNNVFGVALDTDNQPHNVSGSIHNNLLNISLDCSNIMFKQNCTQSYVGFITKSSVVGTFKGDMGEGAFVIHKNLFAKRSIKVKPTTHKLTLNTSNLYPLGIGSISSDEKGIFQTTSSNKTFLLVNINGRDLERYNHNPDLYLTNINLIITRAASMSQAGDFPLYIYNYSYLDKENPINNIISELGPIKNSTLNYKFKIDLPYDKNDISRFLIGPTQYGVSIASNNETNSSNNATPDILLELVYSFPQIDID